MQKPNSVVILFSFFFKKICKRRHFSLSLQKLRTKHRRGAWKLSRLWTWHGDPISAPDIRLSSQLHML